jgi:hypothetical protein
MIDLRLPQINGSEREQLAQIRSYLFQIIPQLELALNAGDNGSHSTVQIVQAAPVSHVSARIADAWIPIGLSHAVYASDDSVGRIEGSGCAIRVDGDHIYTAFNCKFECNETEVQINANPIPEGYRPKRDVHAVCVTDAGFASVRIDPNGFIFARTAGAETVDWIDGYIDYWI